MPTRMLRAVAAFAVLAAAACSAITIPDYANMPLTSAGTPVMSDQGAIGTAAYLLASPSRTAGNPAEGARAMAAVDYLAGALYENPHWTAFPAITKVQMLQGREEERAYLGVAPGTPSQVVVDSLMRVSAALEAGDTRAAEAALPPHAFTYGPQETIARLSHLPYLTVASVAAQKANADITLGCELSPNCG